MNTQAPPDPTPDFTACPHWGKGGRYVIAADGNRVPAPAEIDSVPVADAAAPAATVQPAPKKGR